MVAVADRQVLARLEEEVTAAEAEDDDVVWDALPAAALGAVTCITISYAASSRGLATAERITPSSMENRLRSVLSASKRRPCLI